MTPSCNHIPPHTCTHSFGMYWVLTLADWGIVFLAQEHSHSKNIDYTKKTNDTMGWSTVHMFCRSPSVFLLRTLTFCFFHCCCVTIHLARLCTLLHEVTMDGMPLADWVRLLLMLLLLLLLLKGGLQKKWPLPLFKLLRNSANQLPFLQTVWKGVRMRASNQRRAI